MEVETLLAEYMRINEELTELTERTLRLENEGLVLRKTLDTVLRLKCKRGQGAFCTNIDLVACVRKNAELVLDRMRFDSSRKAQDMVAEAILHVLTGPDNGDIPCVVLDANVIVYKSPDELWLVANVAEFAKLLYELLYTHVMDFKGKLFREREHEVSDVCIAVFNAWLQEHSFGVCVKKALRLYKDL